MFHKSSNLKAFLKEPINYLLVNTNNSQATERVCPASKGCVCTKVKSCYNPLRLGTVIVLVSSGIDFVNTPRLYSDRATR